MKVCIWLPCHVLLDQQQWKTDLTLLWSQREFMMSAEGEQSLRAVVTNWNDSCRIIFFDWQGINLAFCLRSAFSQDRILWKCSGLSCFVQVWFFAAVTGPVCFLRDRNKREGWKSQNIVRNVAPLTGIVRYWVSKFLGGLWRSFILLKTVTKLVLEHNCVKTGDFEKPARKCRVFS